VDDGVKYHHDKVQFDKAGAAFNIRAIDDAPTIWTNKYLFFGKVEVTLQAAPGRGIITSVVLASDSEDEVDWVSSIPRHTSSP
jgi:hypothetical protein